MTGGKCSTAWMPAESARAQFKPAPERQSTPESMFAPEKRNVLAKERSSTHTATSSRQALMGLTKKLSHVARRKPQNEAKNMITETTSPNGKEQATLAPASCYAATVIVHTPSGPVPACEEHADKIRDLMRFMGAHVTFTEASPGDECSNCHHEAKRHNEKADAPRT